MWGVLLFVALLASCETFSSKGPSLDERAMMCKPVQSEECVALRKRADRQAVLRNRPKCPSNYVLYRDFKGERCVSEREISRMLELLIVH